MQTLPPTTILTIRLDAAAQAWFDGLRREHYPPELNRIAAHLTLFHTLPQTTAVRSTLLEQAAQTSPFTLDVSGLRSLGRGVAYIVQAPKLNALQGQLAASFAEHLTAQDRQGFRPHIVVQNKVAAVDAGHLLAQLQASFVPQRVSALGFDWWEYLGGPWSLLEYFPFALAAFTAP